ncbi:MAG TPA: glycosyltransferase family 8 protein [Lacipirellulaceae bacterium]|nr:glycosyltransferase family 8 protein [Lacipirellulaceae bacterium]
MTSRSGDNWQRSKRDPVVVLAADERFALPLAVTVRSALENLAANRTLRLFVLDGGFRDETKQRLERSWQLDRCEISWTAVDPAVLAVAPVSGHANVVNYFRVLTPWLLPSNVQRVIYLDADLVVNTDLTRLWESSFDGQLCLAVQDSAAPYFDALLAMDNYQYCRRHLGSATPVANYRDLGLNPRGAYFNSGVMLLDLAAWRAKKIPQRLLACLAKNKPHIRWWDQYALNVVLADSWGFLDPRWNQQSHIYVYPTWSQSPYDRESFQRLRDEPWIVHFTTRYKPWLASCLHPRRGEFFRYVDQTDWAQWRPWHGNHLKAAFDYVRAQNRRLRRERHRLVGRVAEVWARWQDRAA